MNGGEALSLARQVESSQLMVPQREIPVSSFYIGTCALEHVREFGRLGFELALLGQGQVAQRSAGLKEWGAKALDQCTKRLPLCHCPG